MLRNLLVILAAFLLCGSGCGEDRTPGAGGRAASPPPVGVPSARPEAEPPAKANADAWVRRIRPDLSILIVGNQRGKLKPCGCSDPQLGGLGRLAALIERARARAGGRLVSLSMGWASADRGEEQSEAKAALYRRALEVLSFDGMLLGTPDLFVPALAQPFEDTLRPAPPGNAPLSDRGPLAVAARTSPLVDITRDDLSIRALTLLDPAHLPRLGGVAVGVWPPDGVLGRLPPKPDALWIVSTDATGEGIASVQTAMRRLGPTVIVDFEGGAGVDALESRPLSDGPFLVSLANLGKEVGLIDLVRAEDGAWLLSWHTIPLEPKFGVKYDSPLRTKVLGLFDRYRAVVRERGYLRRFTTHPDDVRARNVGSARCAVCHPGIYESWSETAHAVALETLEDKGYEWDPECVRCHVVGFQRLGDGKWARSASAFVDPERTPYLAGVGCESCHGPGSAHVDRPTDRSLWAPGGPNRRHPGKRGCAVCHDVENSHQFPDHYADEYLPAVDHRGVPASTRTVLPKDR